MDGGRHEVRPTAVASGRGVAPTPGGMWILFIPHLNAGQIGRRQCGGLLKSQGPERRRPVQVSVTAAGGRRRPGGFRSTPSDDPDSFGTLLQPGSTQGGTNPTFPPRPSTHLGQAWRKRKMTSSWAISAPLPPPPEPHDAPALLGFQSNGRVISDQRLGHAAVCHAEDLVAGLEPRRGASQGHDAGKVLQACMAGLRPSRPLR